MTFAVRYHRITIIDRIRDNLAGINGAVPKGEFQTISLTVFTVCSAIGASGLSGAGEPVNMKTSKTTMAATTPEPMYFHGIWSCGFGGIGFGCGLGMSIVVASLSNSPCDGVAEG